MPAVAGWRFPNEAVPAGLAKGYLSPNRLEGHFRTWKRGPSSALTRPILIDPVIRGHRFDGIGERHVKWGVRSRPVPRTIREKPNPDTDAI